MGGVKINYIQLINYTTPKNITYDELILKIPAWVNGLAGFHDFWVGFMIFRVATSYYCPFHELSQEMVVLMRQLFHMIFGLDLIGALLLWVILTNCLCSSLHKMVLLLVQINNECYMVGSGVSSEFMLFI
jgi:hypothetical protein